MNEENEYNLFTEKKLNSGTIGREKIYEIHITKFSWNKYKLIKLND